MENWISDGRPLIMDGWLQAFWCACVHLSTRSGMLAHHHVYIFHSTMAEYISARQNKAKDRRLLFIYFPAPSIHSPLFLLIYFMSFHWFLFFCLPFSSSLFIISSVEKCRPPSQAASAVDADKHGLGQGKHHWLQLQSLHQNDLPLWTPFSSSAIN